MGTQGPEGRRRFRVAIPIFKLPKKSIREDGDDVVVVDDDCANNEELGGGIDAYFTEDGREGSCRFSNTSVEEGRAALNWT